jgi:hypothetical protein
MTSRFDDRTECWPVGEHFSPISGDFLIRACRRILNYLWRPTLPRISINEFSKLHARINAEAAVTTTQIRSLEKSLRHLHKEVSRLQCLLDNAPLLELTALLPPSSGNVVAENASVYTSTHDRLGTPEDYRRALQELHNWRSRATSPLIYMVRRRPDEAIILIADPQSEDVRLLRGEPLGAIHADLFGGRICRLYVRTLRADGALSPLLDVSFLLAVGRRRILRRMRKWFSLREPALEAARAEGPGYFETLELLARKPGLLDFVAPAVSWARHDRCVPFDQPDTLPAVVPAAPRQRSALFINNSYYQFKYLSSALRARGWDALSVSFEAPDSPSRQFYHGEDLTVFDADPEVMITRIRKLLQDVPERFGAVHFYGQGLATLFPGFSEHSPTPRLIPWDFLELRRHNVIIGYTPSGCLDGATQSSIRTQTDGVCGRCIWELHPEVCSDTQNRAWARKLAALCDVITLEGDHAVDDRVGPKYVKRPVTTALDPEVWQPELSIPEEHRIIRRPEEVLVYHAFGNAKLRQGHNRDIKGSRAVSEAVDRLQKDGMPVRMFFATDLPSKDVRYYQVQADIIIDQLNYGRFGANAREALMLGKPLVTRIIPQQGPGLPDYYPLLDSPAVNATEETVYDVLRGLIGSPQRRQTMGAIGREYALKWHSAPACAARYERMIERIRTGLPAEGDEMFPVRCEEEGQA